MLGVGRRGNTAQLKRKRCIQGGWMAMPPSPPADGAQSLSLFSLLDTRSLVARVRGLSLLNSAAGLLPLASQCTHTDSGNHHARNRTELHVAVEKARDISASLFTSVRRSHLLEPDSSKAIFGAISCPTLPPLMLAHRYHGACLSISCFSLSAFSVI